MNPLMLAVVLFMATAVAFTSCKKDDDEDLDSTSFSYAFNTGQVGAGTAYSGSHPSTLTAELTISEKENGNAMVSVTLNNTVDGETYMIHSHDAADPTTTPNGTPYNETPNANVLVQMAAGNGGSVTVSQESTYTYDELLNTYEAFFVVHDPTQAISTTDLTTYLAVGAFAR